MSDNQQESVAEFNMSDLSAALSAEDRAGLVNVLKSKLNNLSGQHPDFLDTLPANVMQRVGVLKDLQSQHDELEAKYLEEKAELEAKYLKLYEPLYAKRYEIVNGLTEVEGASNDNVVDKENESADKGVPNFWLTAMKSNDVLADEISESDEGALRYLKDVKWSRVVGAKGFKVEFFFESNPYFKNSVLTKTYEMINEEEHILEKAIGTEIDWYPGKNLTQKVVRKKSKKGTRSLKPPITETTENCESFFNFFNPPQIPDDEEEIDEDTAELLQNQMEQDYDIGSTIRDKIIPHAVSWFTGEAAENDEYDIDDEEDDDDEELDDEEDEDDDDDDDDDDDEDDEDVNDKKK